MLVAVFSVVFVFGREPESSSLFGRALLVGCVVVVVLGVVRRAVRIVEVNSLANLFSGNFKQLATFQKKRIEIQS